MKECTNCGHKEFVLWRTDTVLYNWLPERQEWDTGCTVDTPQYEIRCKRCDELQDDEEFE